MFSIAGGSTAGQRLRAFAAIVLAVSGVAVAPAPALAAAAGTDWTVQATPNPQTPQGRVRAISCASANVCTAVGFSVDPAGNEIGIALHSTAAGWTSEPVPSPASHGPARLEAVSCPALKLCVALGRSGTDQSDMNVYSAIWNGSTWSLLAVPTPKGTLLSFLTAVSCPTTTWCMGTGQYFTENGGFGVPLVETWDGRAWTQAAFPALQVYPSLVGVSCSTTRACMAVGRIFNQSFNAVTLAEWWNGTTWTRTPTPNPATGSDHYSLSEVACTSASACMAIGPADLSTNHTGPIERWDGSAWTLQTPAAHTGLLSLSGVACAGAASCVAVGRLDGQTQPVAEVWDGASWSQQTPSNAGAPEVDLTAVSCPTVSTCRAAGTYQPSPGILLPVIDSQSGAAWAATPVAGLPGSVHVALNGVGCASSRACFAVGSSGFKPSETVLTEQWDGSKWVLRDAVQPTTPLGAQFTAVAAVPTGGSGAPRFAAVGFIYGGGSLIEVWDGQRWQLENDPGSTPSDVLAAVACPGPSFCLAVGSNATGLVGERWNGSTWAPFQPVAPAAPAALTGISCASVTDCTAVGHSQAQWAAPASLVEHWDGSTWTVVPSPSPSDMDSLSMLALNSVSCPSAGFCEAVGSYRAGNALVHPLALHWDGSAWMLEAPPEPAGAQDVGLLGVTCAGSDTCRAVGSYSDPSKGNASALAADRGSQGWTLATAARPYGWGTAVLSAVTCTNASACFSAGSATSTNEESSAALVESSVLGPVSYLPSVTGLSPAGGGVGGGTRVTVSGAHLQGATAVHFGTAVGGNVVLDPSGNSLTVVAPAAGSPGAVHVTVTTPSGTSRVGSSDLFVYQGAPTITSISPGGGPLSGGTRVTIVGANLTGATDVRFGPLAGTGVVVDPSGQSLTVIAPRTGSSGAMHVTVTTPGGTSPAGPSDLFTYQPAPTITAVSPGGGPLSGGTRVTVTGANLTGGTAVRFGPVQGSGVVVSPDGTAMTVVAPPAPAGTVSLTVTTWGGASTPGTGDSYLYEAPPAVTAVSPPGGPLAGGTRVTVSGTDFRGATAVLFGGIPGTGLTVDPSGGSLTVVAPRGAAGQVDVSVTAWGGTSPRTHGDAYIYTSPPVSTVDTPAVPLVLPAGSITGTASDDGAPISAVSVTLTPAQGGAPTTVVATCSSGCGTISERWAMAVAGLHGVFTVTAVATNSVGMTGPASPGVMLIVLGGP